MRHFINSLFSMYIFDIELPYVVLYFSLVMLLPFETYLSIKAKNKVMKWIPAIIYLLVACYYFLQHLKGLHWDGVSYLVPVFFNVYLMCICAVGVWCARTIKQYGSSPIIKLCLAALLEALLMIALLWWGVNEAPGEGITVLLAEYFLICPVVFGISGFLAGKEFEQYWLYPLMALGIFLIGCYEARLYQIVEILQGYTGIAVIAFIIGAIIKNKSRRLE